MAKAWKGLVFVPVEVVVELSDDADWLSSGVGPGGLPPW